MTTPGPRARRRSDALTRERIVATAVEILDRSGASELTFRDLTTRLSTGAGAIYHHVESKDELLAAAAQSVVGPVFESIAPEEEPVAAIRGIALGIFDAIDAHPWVGAQLLREPWQPAVLQIWTGLGAQLIGLGVRGTAQSDAGAALVSYVLGSAAHYAAGARRIPPGEDRKAFLETLARRWAGQEADPAVGAAAALLPEHDDREQFLAGVEIFLAGIAARR